MPKEMDGKSRPGGMKTHETGDFRAFIKEIGRVDFGRRFAVSEDIEGGADEHIGSRRVGNDGLLDAVRDYRGVFSMEGTNSGLGPLNVSCACRDQFTSIKCIWPSLLPNDLPELG